MKLKTLITASCLAACVAFSSTALANGLTFTKTADIGTIYVYCNGKHGVDITSASQNVPWSIIEAFFGKSGTCVFSTDSAQTHQLGKDSFDSVSLTSGHLAVATTIDPSYKITVSPDPVTTSTPQANYTIAISK